VYLPGEDLARFGCEESELGGGEVSAPLRALLAFEAERAHALLDAGSALARSLRLRPRFAVAGFVAGGRAALDALANSRYEVLAARPRPTGRSFARRWLRAVMAR
jgi:phytoene/squalene synthetase